MKHTVPWSPRSFCKKIRSHLLLKGSNVSISTISCRLSKKFGLKSYKTCKETTAHFPNEKEEIGVCQETYQLEC